MSIESEFMVAPIHKEQQQRVVQEVNRYLRIAEAAYAREFADIPVLFDIKGKVAGMYRLRVAKAKARKSATWLSRVARASLSDLGNAADASEERCIRFNPWLFAKYPEDSWMNTIPHEVAHYVTDCLHGIQHIRPHGEEWREVMRAFGAAPTVRAHYDLAGIPIRRIKRYAYRCNCRTVQLSAYRHNKIQSGQQRYRCRECAAELVLQDGVSQAR